MKNDVKNEYKEDLKGFQGIFFDEETEEKMNK